jgi:S1-C subfamily serine protease
MDRIVVSSREVAEIGDLTTGSAPLQPKLQSPIHWGLKTALSILVLCLPLLCFFAIIMRVALRNQAPRIRYAWTAYLATLLIISGFLTSATAVAFFSLGGSVPGIAGSYSGSADLDERQQFPRLPSATPMDSVAISQELKPLTVVVAPGQRGWFGKGQFPGNSYGAGMLLYADGNGYLLATARHVVDDGKSAGDAKRVLVATTSGIWSQADVIARHKSLDLVLLWIPRHSGSALFTQPIAKGQDGEQIYVIGHPEGLKFTLSNGIISRLDGSLVQISAPVSPGNSGGPVYDDHGNLIAVVTAKMDHNLDPNAENLNFAVSAQALADPNGWDFSEKGRQYFDAFVGSAHTLKTYEQ